MAITTKPTATVTYTVVDETGSTGKFAVDILSTTASNAALIDAETLMNYGKALTDCAILGFSVAYSAFEDAPAEPAAGSRVERKGKLNFITAAGKTVSYSIPGIKSSVVLKSGRIDEDSPAVKNFVDELTAAGSLYCDSNGSDLKKLVAAYERSSSTTRKQLPSDRKPDANTTAEAGA